MTIYSVIYGVYDCEGKNVEAYRRKYYSTKEKADKAVNELYEPGWTTEPYIEEITVE